MIRIELYDGTKTYMYPNGHIATPERIEKDFPAITLFPHVLEVNGNVCQAVMELASLRGRYDIDESLTDAEAIQEIETIVNTPAPEYEDEPTAEERIAAALEYQNLLSL